jgi:hypothetical protein
LALTVGSLGVGIMNSMTFSLLANSNSKVDGNQISFGTVDFQPHPPTLTPVFARLDQEMDLTIGSLNFRVSSLGSIRLSDPTKWDPSVGKIRDNGNIRIIGRLFQRGKLAGQLHDDGKYRRQN